VPGTRSSSRLAASLELKQAAAFRAALRQFLGRTEAATADAGLTPQRYDLLLAISAAGGESTINELCTHLDMRQTAVTELVKRAEEAGLVTRTSSTVDRRVVLVHLTPEAEARFKRCFAALAADRGFFADALESLKETLESPLEADSPLGPSSQPGR